MLCASGLFATYPDIKKDFDISKFFMAAILVFFVEKDTNDEDVVVSEEKVPVKKPVKFEDKYLEKFRSMQEVDVDEESLIYNVVIEHTPLGNVAMTYDKKKETFIYYSDHGIPYRFLEVVARKFAVTFNCKKLVVDTEEELKKLKDGETKKVIDSDAANPSSDGLDSSDKESSKTAQEPEPEKKSVFAKFKSYNKSSAPSTGSTSRDTSGTTKKTTNEPVMERANRYTCEGKFSNMSMLQQVKKDVFDDRLKMSFADFKKMTMSTNNK